MIKSFSIFFTVLILSIFPQIAQAATSLSVNFTRETGVGPFTGTGPGNDAGPNDSIIRTNDIISYKFEVLVQGGDATNIVFNLSFSPGLTLSLPAFCRQPLSTISGNAATGYSVVCNVGNVGEGSQVLYSLPAKVAPDRANNSTVSILSASVQSDQTPQESFTGATDTVSARPRLDLVKTGHTRLIGRRPGPSGEDGVVYVFPIIVNAEGDAKGNELVTAPISFTDDLSGVSPNARLYEGWAGTPPSACGPNYSITGYQLWSQIPRGSTQISDGGPGGAGAGPADYSVWNSGDIQCSPTTTGGETTTVTITGADLSGSHQPTRSANGGGLNASKTYLVAGNMIVWIPMQDIIDAGNQLPVNNTYGPLTALSISGQPNTDPNVANNTRAFVAQDGAGGRYFYNHIDHNNFRIIPGQTSRRSSDGYILPNQVFATRIFQYNRSWLTKTPYNNFGFCTSFDNSTQIIKEITPGQGAKIHYSGTYEGGQDQYVIEYGTGAFGATAFCDDGDSPGGWHTDIDSVPGGPTAITKVRAFTPQFSPPGGNSTQTLTSLIVRYEALDNPIGTYVAQWGTFKYDELNGGNWFAGTPYDETVGLGSYGDRLSLTKVSARVAKDTVPSGQNQVLAGDQLTFKLQPSATTPIDPPGLTADVTVTDTLPVHYDYILGSASTPPSSTAINPDGTTTLVWEFPDTVINSAMTSITYDILVKPTTKDQTSAINKVVASSPSDGSPENIRSDNYGMLVLNPSGFSVYKTAAPELVSPDKTFGYDLTYANTGTSDFPSIVIIDIIPNETIIQNPPTEFDGNVAFVSVSGTSGETFEYTRATPTTIVEEPNDPSNQPGGSTVWCSGFTGGTCPSNPSEVTAFRATSPAFLQGQPARTISLTMAALSNEALNVYSNRFVARAEGLAFAVTSPVATSRVRTADLSLSKSVIGPVAPSADIVTFNIELRNDGPHDAVDVSVRDNLPSGYRYISESGPGTYDPNTGIWELPFLAVSATANLNIRAQVLPTGGYVNLAEIVEQSYSDPDSSPNNMGFSPSEDDEDSASILAYLSGNIFIDNGTGGGIAHDGLLNGGEAPANVGTLLVAESVTGAQVTSIKINADGTWFAVLPDGMPSALTFTVVPNAGYRVISEGTSTLPAVVNPDGTDGIFQFTPTPASRHMDINFGLIRKPTLTQNQVAAIASGQVVELSHVYTATTTGSVAFSITNEIQNPADAFASNIFLDISCDGTSDEVITSPLPVVAGQMICLNVRTQAGSGIGSKSRFVYDVEALTTYAGSSITDLAVNSDSLVNSGAGSGDLVLRKLVRNVTAGTPEGTSNTGKVGDTIEYRILMNNPAALALTDVTVNDMTPAYTALAGPVTSPVVVAPGVTCILQVPAAGNAAGYAGALEWYCPGQFPPSTEGSLTFQVKISP